MKNAFVAALALLLVLSGVSACGAQIVNSAPQVTPTPTQSVTPEPTAEPGKTLSNYIEIAAAITIIVLVAGLAIYFWKYRKESGSA